MATKSTYVYKIMMGHNDSIERTEYCYARNSSTALAEYTQKFKDEKYNTFKAVMFGEANRKKHPGPFEEMPEDEVKALKEHNIGNAPAYSMKKTETAT